MGDCDPLKIVAQSLAPQLRSLGKGAFLSRPLRRAERANPLKAKELEGWGPVWAIEAV
jgi:hypothetical protein